MDKIQEILEEFQAFSKDKEHMLQTPDLTKTQRKAVVAEYIKASSIDDLLEDLLQCSSHEEVSRLLVELFKSKQSDYKQISAKIVKALGNILDAHYNDNIDERLSDIWWAQQNESLDSIPASNAYLCRRELLTPYGDPLFLGGK